MFLAGARVRAFAGDRPDPTQENERMAVKAQFDSRCPGCGGQIRKGDDIAMLAAGAKKKAHCMTCVNSGAVSMGQAAASTTHSQAKSCLTCPSYLKPDEVKEFFGFYTNFPMCATFGKVLGRDDLVPAAHSFLGEKVAVNCGSHGNPRPQKGPQFRQSVVATPRPDVVGAGAPTAAEQAGVNSCMSCKNFITSDKTQDAFGWPSPMCGATGRLLLGGTSELRDEAAMCNLKRSGTNRNTAEGMNIIPIFIDAEAYDPDPVKAFLSRKGAPVVDPQDYPTDEEVSDDDESFGIRAWRHIHSTDGSGRYVRLPIFDFNSFPPEEQLQIPQTGDPEHPEWYVDVNGYVFQAAVSLWEIDLTPAFIGQPGTGKTELARHIAWLMGLPFRRISLTEESETDDLIGHMEFVNNETRFVKGRLVSAWTKRGVVLLDEPNTAPDAVWQRIRPLTDNSKQVALDEAGGEILNRDPYSFVMLAMNPSWDARNIGTKELSVADKDRIIPMEIDLPPAAVEKEIVRRACVEGDGFEISESDLDKVMGVAEDIRGLVENGFPITWGIRPNIKAARMLRWFDPMTAYKLAVANHLEQESRETLLDNVRSRWAL